MKKLGFTIIAALIVFSSFAQSPLPKGAKQFNAGFGLAEGGLPVYFGLDFGVHPDISVGVELSYRSFRDSWGPFKYRHNVIGISGNGNYHFNRILHIPSNWDLYAGLNLGFYVWSSPDDYKGNRSSGLGLGAQVGGRYYFAKNVGVNLEVGGGNAFSGGKIGISVRF